MAYLDTPLKVIRARQEGNAVLLAGSASGSAAGSASGARHEVDPAMVDEVARQLEVPVGGSPDASDGSEGEVLVFRPGDDVEDFINKLK